MTQHTRTVDKYFEQGQHKIRQNFVASTHVQDVISHLVKIVSGGNTKTTFYHQHPRGPYARCYQAILIKIVSGGNTKTTFCLHEI